MLYSVHQGSTITKARRATLCEGVSMRAILISFVIVVCAGTTNAGTIFPSLSNFEWITPTNLPQGYGYAGGEVDGFYNKQASAPWSESLVVERISYFVPNSLPDGPGEGPTESYGIDLSPPGTNYEPTQLSDVIANPQIIPGLPDGFNVVAVSPDFMWATNGSELYHVPSPQSLTLGIEAVAVVLIVAGYRSRARISRIKKPPVGASGLFRARRPVRTR
jgi:hypothetical protein